MSVVFRYSRVSPDPVGFCVGFHDDVGRNQSRTERALDCAPTPPDCEANPTVGASLLSPCVFRQRAFCPPLLRSRSGGGEASSCLRQLPAACVLSAFCPQVVRLRKVASALYPQKKSRVWPSRVALRLCQSLFRLFRDAAPAASVASPVVPGPFYLFRFPGRLRSFPIGSGRRKLPPPRCMKNAPLCMCRAAHNYYQRMFVRSAWFQWRIMLSDA